MTRPDDNRATAELDPLVHELERALAAMGRTRRVILLQAIARSTTRFRRDGDTASARVFEALAALTRRAGGREARALNRLERAAWHPGQWHGDTPDESDGPTGARQ